MSKKNLLRQALELSIAGFSFFLILTSIFWITACGKIKDRKRPTGTIVFGDYTEKFPVELNPLQPGAEVVTTVSYFIYRSLFRLTPAGDVEKDLVEEAVPAEDARVWRFKLRKDYFQDGSPITSFDVANSFSAYLESGYSVLPKSLVTKVETPDASEFVIHLQQTMISLPRYLTGEILKPMAGAVKTPVGSGLFKIGLINNSDIALDWDAEWNPKQFHHIRLHYYRSQDDLWIGILKKEVDIAKVYSMSLAETLKNIPSLRLYSVRAPYYSIMTFNLESPAFRDRMVRQAIVEKLENFPLPVVSGYRCNGPDYRLGLASGDHKKQKVESSGELPQVLVQAGYHLNEGRLALANNLVDFSLSVCAQDRDLVQLALWIKENLRDIGLYPSIEVLAFDRAFERMRRGDFDALLCENFAVSSRQYFHSDALTNSYNIGHYSNKEADRFLDEMEQADSPDRLKSANTELMKVFHEDPPGAFLSWRANMVVADSSIVNIKLNPFRLFENLDEWERAPR